MTEAGDIALCNAPIEIAHWFEVELNRVVIVNLRFALESLDRAEYEEIQQREKELDDEDNEVLCSAISHVTGEFEELRQAALQLALVGVITRLQHWVALFTKRVPEKYTKSSASLLVSQLAFLNKSLGCGPESASFFEEVVCVRDSIIHADSQAAWKHGDDRHVADRYRNLRGEVELSEAQLQETVEKACRQVAWYDEQLRGLEQNTGVSPLRDGR
jgi:hypothetical protein